MSYEGPARLDLSLCERGFAVQVHLSGRWEPVDGRYHWGGRIEPSDEDHVTSLVRTGRRKVQLSIADGEPATARLAEVDPWGGVRITGVGTPPWQT